jgi:hypothetical protein
VHNQKIECFWSHFLEQFGSHWREVFQDLEIRDLWEHDDEMDRIALVYVYMPIIRQEIALYRNEYNSYPIRYNHLSRLPSGPPEDNFFLEDDVPDFSIAVHPSWMPIVRRERLNDYDANGYLDAATANLLDRLMQNSPLGSAVNIQNAKDQYLFLREILHR